MLISSKTMRRMEYMRVDKSVCSICGLKGDGRHQSPLECIRKLRDVIGEIMLFDRSSRKFGLYELYKGSEAEYILACRSLIGKALRLLSSIAKSETIEMDNGEAVLIKVKPSVIEEARKMLSFRRNR